MQTTNLKQSFKAQVTTEHHTRHLTDYGKDNRRVYADLCAIHGVKGSSYYSGIQCRVTAKGRG